MTDTINFELTENQKSIFETVENSNANYFITGKPGVGKSVLINSLVNDGRKTYTLAAPTGLAALNINGKTLHSIFRLPIFDGIVEPDYNEWPKDDRALNNIKYNVKHLIIDEVSMVRADTFDYIDRLLRFVKNMDMPFGGVQIIIVGDFYQLPPVTTSTNLIQLKQAGYVTPFAFSAKVFEGNFTTLQLNEVLRQKGDPDFIKILHAARTGEITLPQCGKLNKCIGEVEDLRIMLCGTNKQADLINAKHLSTIQQPVKVFQATEYGTWPAYPVEKVLSLKVGAQVMVKMNGADRTPGDYSAEFVSKVVNGTLAIVESIESDKVLIKLGSGDIVSIYRKRWERKVKEQINGSWEEKVVASYEQMPLSLAWSISIHKSQGQSFEKVYINPTSIFAAGQLYVALSRCRSLDGLKFSSPVSTRKFWADKNVLKFYKQLK